MKDLIMIFILATFSHFLFSLTNILNVTRRYDSLAFVEAVI